MSIFNFGVFLKKLYAYLGLNKNSKGGVTDLVGDSKLHLTRS